MEKLRILDLVDQVRVSRPTAETAMRLAEVAARRDCQFVTNSEEIIISVRITTKTYNEAMEKIQKVLRDLHYDRGSWPTNGWL